MLDMDNHLSNPDEELSDSGISDSQEVDLGDAPPVPWILCASIMVLDVTADLPQPQRVSLLQENFPWADLDSFSCRYIRHYIPATRAGEMWTKIEADLGPEYPVVRAFRALLDRSAFAKLCQADFCSDVGMDKAELFLDFVVQKAGREGW